MLNVISNVIACWNFFFYIYTFIHLYVTVKKSTECARILMSDKNSHGLFSFVLNLYIYINSLNVDQTSEDIHSFNATVLFRMVKR